MALAKTSAIDKGSVNPQTIIAYVFPVIPVMYIFGSQSVIHGVYAKYFGLSLTTIATVVLIARLFDAVTDPIIGFAVDRQQAKGKSKLPFILFGLILYLVASYLLYVPLEYHLTDGEKKVSPLYFGLSYILFYLAYTFFEVPHLAWGGELAKTEREKNNLYIVRSSGVIVGGFLFYLLPQMPFFDSSEITPVVLKWAVMITVLIALPAIYGFIKLVPEPNKSHYLPAVKNNKVHTPLEMIRFVLINKPLLVLLGAVAFTFLGAGISGVLLFLFIDVYLGMGQAFSYIYMVGFAISLVSLKLWQLSANHLGIQKTWVIANTMMIAGALCLSFLSPENNSECSVLIGISLAMSGASAIPAIVPSQISKIVDYSVYKYRSNNSASCFSIYTLVNKTVNSLGGAVGLAVIGFYGFDATASTQTESAVTGLRLALSWVPCGLLLIACILALLVPVTARQHNIILRRLEAVSPK